MATHSIQRFQCDQLAVEVHPTRMDTGHAAARAVADQLQRIVDEQGHARVMFASAPSQNEFLAALVRTEGVHWDRITVFHLDEYVGLSAAQPQSFRHYLQKHLLDHVAVATFHPLQGEGVDAMAECQRYAALVETAPLDLICLGVGENGHLAFNDPHVAIFDDPERVKVVELDLGCRRQQVHDGCFPELEAVPRRALTVTLSVFRQARRLSVVVPGPRKAIAVHDALRHPVSTACPASILRTHPAAVLYLDADAARLVPATK